MFSQWAKGKNHFSTTFKGGASSIANMRLTPLQLVYTPSTQKWLFEKCVLRYYNTQKFRIIGIIQHDSSYTATMHIDF